MIELVALAVFTKGDVKIDGCVQGMLVDHGEQSAMEVGSVHERQ